MSGPDRRVGVDVMPDKHSCAVAGSAPLEREEHCSLCHTPNGHCIYSERSVCSVCSLRIKQGESKYVQCSSLVACTFRGRLWQGEVAGLGLIQHQLEQLFFTKSPRMRTAPAALYRSAASIPRVICC